MRGSCASGDPYEDFLAEGSPERQPVVLDDEDEPISTTGVPT